MYSLDIMFSWCFVWKSKCIFLDNILLNVSVTGQQQHFRPFFDSRFTGHLLDFRLVIDTVLSILPEFSWKQFAKGGNRTPSLPVYVLMGEGISPQTIGVLNVHFDAKKKLYGLKYDRQMSNFWSTLGYNNYSYLGYNAAGVTGGYQVNWMKSPLHSNRKSQIQRGQKPQSSYVRVPFLINVDTHSSCS